MMFLSRLTLFTGVKHLGGLQTALLGLGELLITILFSHLLLGERLNALQWSGVVLLIFSLSMAVFDKPPKKKPTIGGWLNWLTPPSLPHDISLPRD
jgi:drug/metabolite transporter (DMT)-like permease